jgi:hypothetical protein
MENRIRNQDLGAEYAHCNWGVIAASLPQTARKKRDTEVPRETEVEIYGLSRY